MDQQKFNLKSLFSHLFSKGETLREELVDFFDEQDITVTNDQLQMILAVVGLIGFDADKIKIPGPKMITLPITATLKESVSVIKKSGHSRIPVYEEKDGGRNYVGLLYAKDLLPVLIRKEGRFKLADYLRKHYVVPETQSLLSLMREMRLKKHHLALTANEYGDISGLITLEDILEEIVGEIQDEFDSGQLAIKEVGHRTYRIDGSTPMSDVNKQLAINLPEEKFNTVGGFVLHELKGEPSKKAKIQYGQVTVTLEKFTGQQIKSVTIKIPPTNGQ